MSDAKLHRRALLGSLALGGAGLALPGCLMPTKAAPVIEPPAGALGAIPWRRRGGRGLFVGASSIDVTPPEVPGTFLAGFGFQRRARALRDPLFARCLYVDDGVRRVAIVVADVIGVLAPTVARVRTLVGPSIDVAVVSTHNHQSPDTMGYWGEALLYAVPSESGLSPSYQKVFERRLAAAVERAASSARAAQLYFARGALPEGTVRNLRDPGQWDRSIELVEARDAAGATIATFVNLACHPETLGDRARLMSADFPGRLRARLEAARGGTSVFANGALGGMITPDLDDDLDVPARSRFVDQLGDHFAEAALTALAGAKRHDVEEVRYHRASVELPPDNELFRYVERVGLVEARARGPGGGFITEVGRIDLGPASLALVPGEPTPKVGLRIKDALRAQGAEHPIVVGLGNDELGYVLDPAQWDTPSFDYERTVSAGRDTAPRLEAALAALPPRRVGSVARPR